MEQRGRGGAGLRGSRGAGEAGSAPSARPARAWDGHPAPSPGNTQQINGPLDGPPPPAEAEHGTRASRRSVLRGPHVAQSPSGFDPVAPVRRWPTRGGIKQKAKSGWKNPRRPG